MIPVPLFLIDTIKCILQIAEGRQTVGSTVRRVYSRGCASILSRHRTSTTESGAGECSGNFGMGDDMTCFGFSAWDSMRGKDDVKSEKGTHASATIAYSHRYPK